MLAGSTKAIWCLWYPIFASWPGNGANHLNLRKSLRRPCESTADPAFSSTSCNACTPSFAIPLKGSVTLALCFLNLRVARLRLDSRKRKGTWEFAFQLGFSLVYHLRWCFSCWLPRWDCLRHTAGACTSGQSHSWIDLLCSGSCCNLCYAFALSPSNQFDGVRSRREHPVALFENGWSTLDHRCICILVFGACELCFSDFRPSSQTDIHVILKWLHSHFNRHIHLFPPLSLWFDFFLLGRHN